MTTRPHRRQQLTLDLGADDRESLRSALMGIIHRLDEGEPDDAIDIVSGGYDSSFTLIVKVDKAVTHEGYINELTSYLEQRDAS
jgi:hypothetical protein